MTESTARFALPLIAAGQAQKEIAHNEALAALDLIAQAAVTAVGVNTPPSDPAPGACWIVGTAPTGAWAGHAHALVGWTTGGWRFVAAREGMTVWTGGSGGFAQFSSAAWATGAVRGSTLTLGGDQVVGPRHPAIADPAGGATVDAEARTALVAILTAMRTHGLIST